MRIKSITPTATNIEVFGLESSLVRSGYSMRSAPLSEEEFAKETEETRLAVAKLDFSNKNLSRAIKLVACPGTGHDQFLTGITVNFDLTLTNKAWTEAERYTFLNFISSMSTIHRARAFAIDQCCDAHVTPTVLAEVRRLQEVYNSIDGNLHPEEKAEAYLDLLYNLPSGFRLTAGMTTNYRCLGNIYSQRYNHTLPDWHEVCAFIKSLPLSRQLITERRGA